MYRWIATVLALSLFSFSASADFYFLIPGPEGKSTLQLVFNDQPKVNALSDVHAETKIKTSKGPIPTNVGGPGWLEVQAPEAGPVTGVIEHGIVLRGQPNSALVLFYVKHQRELSASTSSGSNTAVELEAVRRGSGISFVAKHQGRVVPNVDVLVYGPGEKRAKAVRTDSLGSTTSFEPEGLYAARLYLKEQKNGEFQGRAFQEVRHYATLTVKFSR
jgi:hypothetical protein